MKLNRCFWVYWAICLLMFCGTCTAQTAYLFTSFRGSDDGLHLAWSTDAKQWNELHGVFLKSEVGSGLMRDPFVLRGQGRRDGDTYHMVWTTGWSDKGIGYATTRDFVHWSLPRYFPFMEEVEGTRNCWAPEIVYDDTRQEYMITWSSSVDGRFSETESDVRMNNRTYYVTTRNFREFSEPQVLIDPGFDHIDTTITKDGDRYIAVIKEGDKRTGQWGPIHWLTASDPRGPWTLHELPIVTERAEGPALAKVNGETLLYFDYYTQHRYGARATTDWTSWRDVTPEVKTVDGQRHGSVIEVPQQVLDFLLVRDKGWEVETPASVVPVNTADPSIRVFGDRYYLYPTTDRPNWMTTEFNVWSSPNLVDWTFENTIIDLTKQIDWANIRAWAPDCIERDGKYYFYFCGDGKIGVATSDSPTGPFTDALGKPLLQRGPGYKTNTIDPWAMIDNDGQAYLYFGNGNLCQVFKLNEDMISIQEGPYDIPLRDFREGIVVFRRNGKYYFMWSIDDARSPNYRVGWGTADNPLGPVSSPESREDFIVLEKNEPVIGTAHHGVFNVPGTDRWYVAYHRHAIKNGSGYNRQTVLARMPFDDEGRILPMDPMVAPFKPGDRGEPIVNGKGLPGGLTENTLTTPGLTVSIDAGAEGKAISPDLVGIFFEDLSYAADGGLYAELVENRSFEYAPVEQRDWDSLTGWELVERDGGRGMMVPDTSEPLHPNNPHYLVLGVDDQGGLVGLSNDGFDGIVIKQGEHYRFSVFARQLAYPAGTLTVRLETESGELLGEAKLPELTSGWKQYEVTIEATGSADAARLVLLAGHPGRIGLDMISLFPEKTFKDRKNGLRADLAQVIADINPKFVRFPGGCLVHGDGLDNFYRWKDTIGPVHQRKAQRNIWRYHQTLGLGYYEYFLFCEDLGAEPIPVVPAAVSCQNSGASVTRRYGQGQQCVPMEDMGAYIQDVLDLIEWANGPADSEWGSKRAAAGHPEPFGLKYLGVGNEDHITDGFKTRFLMIYQAIKARHPEITVIGTVGPGAFGPDYVRGWAFAKSIGMEMADEHEYKSPDWFWQNLQRWESYDRNGTKVYMGEYAAHDNRRTTTLRSALAEAAYLISMERNGDVVKFSSYAPLLANVHHTSWNPNLIYFDNKEIYPTISYQVQKLFGHNTGDTWLPTEIDGLTQDDRFAVSAVRDKETGDVILKLVNGDGEARTVTLHLDGAAGLATEAQVTVLGGDDPDAKNHRPNSDRVLPETTIMGIGPEVENQLPAYSLTVIRMKRR